MAKGCFGSGSMFVFLFGFRFRALRVKGLGLRSVIGNCQHHSYYYQGA